MTIRAEEIRVRLAEFASRWSVWDRSEREGAQTFLNELFACYGSDRSEVARFEYHQDGKFLDCIWPRNCIIEMKAPGEAKRLSKHRAQALAYWRNSADASKNEPAPRYVVICAFRRLEIWEPGGFPTEPRVAFDLIELPERYDSLLFLTGEGRDAVFSGSQQQVTREAVGKVSELFHMLADRSAAGEGELQDFLLQSVWCMFAEDLGMIPRHGFTTLLEDLITSPRRSSADDLGRMFELLNSPPSVKRHGLYEGIPYANGGLFAEAAHVHLERDELTLLLDAAREYRWDEVEPSIFGSLLEGGLGRDQQWALGAHYTHEVDIQKVVQPTIVRPWRERIENCTTLKQATQARRDLSQFVVLDPACGSGNFLYVAYREIRRIERDLNLKIADLERHAGRSAGEGMTMGSFPLANIRGIELEGFAVKLARVTLWMGHKLAIDELGLAEDPLPLADLSGIRRGDALRVEWPKANAIIGNPPFHGDRHLRGGLGNDYVEWLKNEFNVGVKDYCVYWFRRAVDTMRPGDRAGLVATNSVSQGRARSVSLEHIQQCGGTITDAVSSQVWPGAAAVHVSIVNWVHQPTELPSECRLDGAEVDGITSSLRSISELDPSAAARLRGNRGIAYQGMLPGAKYDITLDTARELIEMNSRNSEVVFAYLTGEDVASRPGSSPSRATIYFGTMPLEIAMSYPAPLSLVSANARALREASKSYSRNPQWWQFLWPRGELFEKTQRLGRYLAGTATGKRVFFAWFPTTTIPSNLTNAFAVDDDFYFAILTSATHTAWAWAQSSTLKSDIRYTPSSAFETFPFPDAGRVASRRAADIGESIFEMRQQLTLKHGIGLTTLYNQVDDGAFRDLARLHGHLDEAVVEAYGWPKSIAQDGDETNRRLLALNLAIANGEVEYDPFAYLRDRDAATS